MQVGGILTIQSRSHPYTVEIVAGLEHVLMRAAANGPVLALVDSKVRQLYSEQFHALDSALICSLEATEEQKSLERLTSIVGWLLDQGLRRGGKLLVVGGGVIQDIGCFCASVLLRGVPWDFVPTTLLAQADSCIGGKSSINIGAYKNQIGTIYPPRRIYLVLSMLNSVSPDDIRAGLGEIIKMHLLKGEKDFQQLKLHLEMLPQNRMVLRDLILNSLRIKKRFIEQDEFDSGIRNLLNYGHTFGHAYESATRYGIPHGIAVTLGVVTATYFSCRLTMVSIDYFNAISAVLRPYYEPYEQQLLQCDPESILQAMKRDKKRTGGPIMCILTRGAGAMEKIPLDPETQVWPLLQGFLGDLATAPLKRG